MYNKIFTQILDSSIWLEPDPTRLVWITLLAAMDEDGFAHFAAIANLAHRARVSLDHAEQAIRTLEGPDPNSSDPAHEGRRVERVPGGWIVRNAKKYRELATRVTQRDQTRLRVRRFRERQRTETNAATCNADSNADRDIPLLLSTDLAKSLAVCNDGRNEEVTRSEAYTEARSDQDLVQPHCPPKETAAQTDTCTSGDLIKLYFELYTERYHVKPRINGGKDGRLFKDLLAQSSYEEVVKALRQYLGSNDAFAVKRCHPVGWFSQEFNRWLVEATGNGRVKSHPPSRTGPCPPGKYDDCMIRADEWEGS